MPKQKLLRSKMFWVGILYFAQGFPFGLFYDVFPVHFRQLGVDLREIGFLSLLGLAWTIKFLWAPAVDHYRYHRRWMLAVDLAMGVVLLFLSMQAGFGPPVWIAIGVFTLLSATNDVAIDGYTIEFLNKNELGLANGIRIGMGRVGILAAGVILILSDYLGWPGAYTAAAGILAVLGIVCLYAPKELSFGVRKPMTLGSEFAGILRRPHAFALVLLFLLGTLWLINNATHSSGKVEGFWWYAFGIAGALLALSFVRRGPTKSAKNNDTKLTEGPMFGALMEMLQRPYIIPVIVFVLIFKLGDSSMGFMVKPFWVDAGFTATQIGLVSVNLGLILSITGGIVGGWFTDRVGIFKALWILGLFQALSNIGYVWAASTLPLASSGAPMLPDYKIILYGASAFESFTGGLGTAAFLAFLMAIVNKQHSATEYAILSSVFALSRQLAGYASGFGAHYMGYAHYFLLTFFLSFPAYVFLPWVKKMLDYAEQQKGWGQG
ncbi:MAG: MFS transporter [Sulfuricaulis sp.]|uniref:MFS transporter n=1 Tax=Sulfuricaulis sp. TaxID=2003553 RepID=UPI003C53031C